MSINAKLRRRVYNHVQDRVYSRIYKRVVVRGLLGNSPTSNIAISVWNPAFDRVWDRVSERVWFRASEEINSNGYTRKND
jgi:hypothetical protein